VGGAVISAASLNRHFALSGGATLVAKSITFRDGDRRTAISLQTAASIDGGAGGSVSLNGSYAYFYGCSFTNNRYGRRPLMTRTEVTPIATNPMSQPIATNT
jgi:hypothetical protein